MMGDSIDRKTAIETVRKCAVKEVTPAYMLIDKAEVMTDLMLLPSVQPQRKTGKWIHIRTEADGNALYECSECHMGEVHVPIVEVKYCWNCGAKMERTE